MRWSVLFLLFLLPFLLPAQNDFDLAQAIARGDVRAIDRHMKRIITQAGKDVRPGSYLHPLGGAEDRIGELWYTLRKQIGVADLEWDRCVVKPAIWPGRWTLGVIFRTREGKRTDHMERCYTIQGGRTGTARLLGMQMKVGRIRDDLKVLGAYACPGFVDAQRELCEKIWPGH